MTKSEKKNLKFVRKSIYAKNNIKKGEIFNEENLVTKRPDLGISSIYWNKIIGKRAIKILLKMRLSKYNLAFFTGSRSEYSLSKNIIKKLKK